MKKCIYTLKTEPDATFIKREHIFPKGIGGVNTLEKGMVCDQVNELFSPLEKKFVQNSPIIQISRGLMGPRGRKKHDKKDSIMVMKCDDGTFCLGYLDIGKPVIINQLICTVKKKNESMVEILSVKIELNPLEINSNDYRGKAIDFILDLEELILKIRSKIKMAQFRIEEIGHDILLVGIFKDNLFIGTSDQNFDFQHFLRSLTFALCKGVIEGKDTLRTNKSKVTCIIKSSFDLDAHCRIVGKIAFNCLAKLYGKELVLQECFNPFRKMLIDGNNVRDFVCCFKPESLKNNSFFASFIKGWEHAVVFHQQGHCLYAMVYFYGNLNFFNVLLTTTLPSNYDIDVNGYFCDWKAQVEYSLMDVIKKYYENSEPVYSRVQVI
ncbi:hypothetical protein [Acidaminococcus massiliensis]|uniref:hypothetical protein n=1 Tax=Acidaminococcus massiliensis TaxID=1852375 RepID=UPI00248F3ADD|nr:hypothetical protein [Acidaminococcus massiliensis]